MAYLTDRSLATGVTLDDLIHIVITGDTSQGNPAGSSYKAKISQVLDNITDIYVTGGTYSNGTSTFRNNTGGTFNVTGFYTGGTDVFVTGGTYFNGTARFVNNTGGTFNVTGFYTGGSDFYTVTAITSSQTLTWDKSYWGISGSSNVDLTLPSTVGKDGYFITIKDEAGNSGSYRIRLTPTSGLIDGNSYVDMNINYMSLTVMVRNGNWYII